MPWLSCAFCQHKSCFMGPICEETHSYQIDMKFYEILFWLFLGWLGTYFNIESIPAFSVCNQLTIAISCQTKINSNIDPRIRKSFPQLYNMYQCMTFHYESGKNLRNVANKSLQKPNCLRKLILTWHAIAVWYPMLEWNLHQCVAITSRRPDWCGFSQPQRVSSSSIDYVLPCTFSMNCEII